MSPRVLPKGVKNWEHFVKGLQIMREVSILPEELTETVLINIVTGVPAGLRNSDSISNSSIRTLPPSVQTGCVPLSAPSSVGTDCSLPGTKRYRHEADQLPPSSAEDKSEWSCSSTLSCFYVTCTATISLQCCWKFSRHITFKIVIWTKPGTYVKL